MEIFETESPGMRRQHVERQLIRERHYLETNNVRSILRQKLFLLLGCQVSAFVVILERFLALISIFSEQFETPLTAETLVGCSRLR